MYLNAPDGSIDVGGVLPGGIIGKGGAIFLIQDNMELEHRKSPPLAVHWESRSSSIPVTLLCVCHDNCFVAKVYLQNFYVIIQCISHHVTVSY
jgi:hypothetical protein